jgi:3-oxoacyl-[acyl-carrier-protein] synthase II
VTSDIPSITGLGLITPLGGDCNETFQSLIAGRFITQNSRAKFDGEQGGNVNELALAAARQAMQQAGWNEWPEDAAIIVGTSKGDIESWIAAIDQIEHYRPADYPWEDRFGLGDLAAYLANELVAPNSIRLTYSAACASGLHALARASMMIQFGEVRRALVVAAESSLHELFQGCFDRLGVLAPPGEPCRPFDLNRRGFHISQAAAAVVIEANAQQDNGGIASINHLSLAGDATHITGSDPAGSTLRRILQSALKAGVPDLIHAHGTGTEANDAVELAAIADVSSSDSKPLPVVYSHKAALGHSLGASGLVSVVLNCLMHQHGTIPGNVCTLMPILAERTPIHAVPLQGKDRHPTCSTPPPTSDNACYVKLRRSLVLAGGFGGATAVVGLRHGD